MELLNHTYSSTQIVCVKDWYAGLDSNSIFDLFAQQIAQESASNRSNKTWALVWKYKLKAVVLLTSTQKRQEEEYDKNRPIKKAINLFRIGDIVAEQGQA